MKWIPSLGDGTSPVSGGHPIERVIISTISLLVHREQAIVPRLHTLKTCFLQNFKFEFSVRALLSHSLLKKPLILTTLTVYLVFQDPNILMGENQMIL